MSPRQIRAEATEQSVITTRSRAQKLNNVNEDVKSTEKIKQKRRRKSIDVKSNMETSIKQNAKKKSPDLTSATISKSTKKKASRRRVKSTKRETENADKIIAHENGSVDSNKSNKFKDKHDESMPIIKYIENNSIQTNSLKNLGSDKIPKRLQRKNAVIDTNVLPCMITPKSTALKPSLTPHRSTKTPKKSPISLGSPKTHSVASPKLLKSPRKLSLTSCDNLDKLVCNNMLEKSKNPASGNTSISDKSLSASPIIKSKQSKSRINPKTIVNKFSKSPKIVLRLSKSKKSKSPKLKLLFPSRIKKSPLKRSLYSAFNTSNLNTTKSIKVDTRGICSPRDKDSLTIKHQLLTPRLMKMLTDLQIKDILAEPVVSLHKLSLKNIRAMVANKNQSDISKHSTTKLSKKSANRLSPNIQKKSSPLMASTPQKEKILIEINSTFNMPITSTDDTSPNTRSRYKDQSNMQLSNTVNGSMAIENILKPSLTGISDANQDHSLNSSKCKITYDISEDISISEMEPENKKDTTYELKEPRTSNLQQMLKKRTATKANLSVKEGIKKTCKVRFANLISDKNNLIKSTKKLNGLQSNTSYKYNKQKNTARFNQNSLIPIKSISNTEISNIIPKAKLAKRSQSFNDMVSNLSFNKIQSTPKTFALLEKNSEKKSSVKKVPNFTRIHEKMFSKSESLIDAKKRLEDRHQAFSVNKALSTAELKKEVLTTDTHNGIHNRFGFKLRKAEATHVMLKKQTVFSRQKQQQETRMILKGVRMNRRFELQMKSRNINT